MNEIKFPPTEVIRLDDETVKRLLAEGMAIRAEIEKRSKSMFIPSPECERLRMR